MIEGGVEIKQLPVPEQISLLKELVLDGYQRIARNISPEGLIATSLDHSEDLYKAYWKRDQGFSIQFATDPDFRLAFPELTEQANAIYLCSMRGFSTMLSSDESLARLHHRPNLKRDQNGYREIDSSSCAPTKIDLNGKIIDNWGNNQPDGEAIFIDTVLQGVERGLPVLDQFDGQIVPIGQFLVAEVAYLVGLDLGRLICEGPWEHGPGYSPYSTRKQGLNSLQRADRNWDKITADGQKQGYQIPISRLELQQAINKLGILTAESFPYDYTDPHNHKEPGDLASLVTANTTQTSPGELVMILKNTDKLESELGGKRYEGDHYKRFNGKEALWTMHKSLKARLFFKMAKVAYFEGRIDVGDQLLERGFERIEDLKEIEDQCFNSTGERYVNELWFNTPEGFRPNTNQLAWDVSNKIKAGSAGIIAIATRQALVNHQILPMNKPTTFDLCPN